MNRSLELVKMQWQKQRNAKAQDRITSARSDYSFCQTALARYDNYSSLMRFGQVCIGSRNLSHWLYEELHTTTCCASYEPAAVPTSALLLG